MMDASFYLRRNNESPSSAMPEGHYPPLSASFERLSIREPFVKSSISPEYVDPRTIQFSQKNVSRVFSDGRTLSDAVSQLASRKIQVEEFPTIRVVKFYAALVTLDNRRLRVFMDAFITAIPIQMMDLKNPDIAKEFWAKKSNKSSVGGGIVKTISEDSKGKHFEEGNFVFNKHVLNWTIEMIRKPFTGHDQSELKDSYFSRNSYYNSFKSLIFEEARGILQNGIEQAEIIDENDLSLKLVKFKYAKNAENPTEMNFSLLGRSQVELRAGEAVLLVHSEKPDLKFIALSNFSESNMESRLLSFKAVLDHSMIAEYAEAFKEGQKWTATSIGSLITLQRMFEACTAFENRKETFLEKSIWLGEIEDTMDTSSKIMAFYASIFPDTKSNSFEEEPLLANLNYSQSQAIEKFLKLKQGLQLIQGPPGTGKTTTIIQLLKILHERDERVLVSAPSNKAVQELAERFVSKYPNIPVILIGTEEKLPANSPLYSVFLDTWGSQIINSLQEMNSLLWGFQLSSLINCKKELRGKSIQDVRENLNTIGINFSKIIENILFYEVNIMEDLEKFYQVINEEMENYCELISRATAKDWNESKAYLEELKEEKYGVKPKEMPLFMSVTSPLLSSISMRLQLLGDKLEAADQDSSSKGLKRQLIDHSAIVFATLSVCGQQRLKEMKPVDSLIIDEAAQAVEAETLIPLRFNPQKCLLIGDTQQLPATVISPNAEELKFGRSLMERLICDCKQPWVMLDTQYRMHPEISSFPSKKYYKGLLKNHESVHNYEPILKNPPFLALPYAFIHSEGKEERGPDGHSFINKFELKAIKTIVEYLKQQDIQVINRVGIITFYKAQADLIQKELKSNFLGIKVNTVDAFQGGESDIIIISCVRSNFKKQIGFLKEAKRLNVALTRAKFSLIVLGNANTLVSGDIGELVIDAKARNLLYSDKILVDLIKREKLTPQQAQHQTTVGQKGSYKPPQKYTAKNQQNSFAQTQKKVQRDYIAVEKSISTVQQSQPIHSPNPTSPQTGSYNPPQNYTAKNQQNSSAQTQRKVQRDYIAVEKLIPTTQQSQHIHSPNPTRPQTGSYNPPQNYTAKNQQNSSAQTQKKVQRDYIAVEKLIPTTQQSQHIHSPNPTRPQTGSYNPPKNYAVKNQQNSSAQTQKKVQQPALGHQNLGYKTELCRHFERKLGCDRGDQCHFAHGLNELRNK